MSDISGTLSICRRAGMLVTGSDEVKNSVKRKTAKLVITASDLSPKSFKEISRVCEIYDVPLIAAAETVDDFSECLGKRFGILSVTDRGFAESLRKKLSADK